MIRETCMGTSRLSTHELHIESVCAECGKYFLRSGEHVYVRKSGAQQEVYCSYTCFRVQEKQEEERMRQEYEAECEKIRQKELWEARYMRAKKLCRGEEVKLHSKADAEAKLEESDRYIKMHTNKMLCSMPGTDERLKARRNMTRWKRKAAYIRAFLAALEEEEREERAKCTSAKPCRT